MRVLTVAFLSASLSFVPSAFAQRGGHPGGSASGPGHPAGATMGHMGGGFAGGSFGRAPRFVAPSPVFEPHAANFVSTAPAHAVSMAPGHAFLPEYHVPVGASPAWRGEGRGGRDRDRRHDQGDFRHRALSPGYAAYPYLYANSWDLLPWDGGSPEYAGSGDYAGDEAQQEQPPVGPDDGYRPEYQGAAEAPYPYPQAPADNLRASAPVAPEPALTLIFSDGHQETIHNYVLTSADVIVLDEAASGRQKRIPLASLDLGATRQAAQQAGLDFIPPA